MQFKKSLLVGATIATVTLGGGGLAMAATDTSASTDSGNSIVEKIATKFNLNKTEVQAVFDEEHAAHEAERAAEQKARLAQAVTDGKITQEQADYITKAQAEIAALMGDTPKQDVDTATRDQIKAKMDALRTWADGNNVDMQYVMGGHGRGPGFDHGPRDGSATGTTDTSAND